MNLLFLGFLTGAGVSLNFSFAHVSVAKHFSEWSSINKWKMKFRFQFADLKHPYNISLPSFGLYFVPIKMCPQLNIKV